MTNSIKNILIENDFKDDNLYEKVHIMMGLIDNVKNLFKNDLI